MNHIYDADAQGLLLSSAMKDRKIRSLVLSRLEAHDMYGKCDKELFHIVEAGSKILPGTLSDAAHERLLAIESTLMVVPEPTEIEAELRKVEEKTALRKIQAEMQRQLQEIERGTTPGAVSGALLSSVAGTMGKLDMQSTYTAADIVAEGEGNIEAWLAGDPFAGLVPTYISTLDRVLGGLVPGHVTTYGARPSKGKTVFALQVARNIAMQTRAEGKDAAVVFASLEMTPAMIGYRLASSIAGVNWKDVRNKAASKRNIDRWIAAHKSIAELPIVIKKMPTPTPQQLLHSIEMEAASRADGIALIVVDFIELMTAAGTNETAQVGNIMKGLKVIAERFDCPVLALSQLSRAVEQRNNRVPEIQDLRQSGTIEAVSQQVMLGYYPAGYQTRVQKQKGTYPNNELQTQSERLEDIGANYLVLIPKNRDEDAGQSVPLLFEPHYMRFAEPNTQAEAQQASFAAHNHPNGKG